MGSTPADLKHDSEFDQSRDELAELRALLLGQQIVELQALQKRLDDPGIRAEELSQVLGKAIALSLKRSPDLKRSFYPIVEQALKISISQEPRNFDHVAGAYHRRDGPQGRSERLPHHGRVGQLPAGAQPFVGEP